MTQHKAKIRLFVDQPLAQGAWIDLSAQANYLANVMRAVPGDRVLVFNGQDGEWLASLTAVGRRAVQAQCEAQTRPQALPPDLWLLFAPIKKARTDFIVEKAVEMGVRRILPVQTDHTNAERIRRDRLQAHATEAAEQCAGVFVPEVAELQPLARLLADWPGQRRLMWCDEALAGKAGARAGLPDRSPVGTAGGPGAASGPWAVLIGPEGGFSQTERDRLRALPQAVAVSLGPRILRADTAAVAALALWQIALGDWT